MYDTVLVPTDGSARSRAAARRAIDLAGASGGSIRALSVIEVDDLGLWTAADVPVERVRASLRDAAEMAVEEIASLAGDAGVDCATEIRIGVPYREILDATAEADADLVVMATHGRTGLEHAILGSTTERVVRLSDVPVLTVRE
ncbi:universal stress protein [Haloferax volcanii]|uniref:Universal stress protein n=1 Tax=Haloferax volcanii TaxID=2246 RepID=A0A6C0UPU5_HALVO|nr:MULTISPECIES: universal stress protein [Haloferax]ELK54205.1 UspA domain-containing protein [Haloferax sp. BAB-2207]QIB77476.1 universal stress protein [Haloferax alexandrinus]